MAPIGRLPFLQYLLRYLRAWKIEHVILCVGHARESIMSHFGDGHTLGLAIQYSIETTLRGTGGAVAQASPLLQSECFWVLNGDTFCDIDLSAMRAIHLDRAAVATIALARVPNTSRYGSVSLNADREVREFTEKSPSRYAAGDRQLINAGVYCFRRDILDMPVMKGDVISMETDVLPVLIGKGLYGYVTEGHFIDIGIPADYERAQQLLPEWLGQPSHDHSR